MPIILVFKSVGRIAVAHLIAPWFFFFLLLYFDYGVYYAKKKTKFCKSKDFFKSLSKEANTLVSNHVKACLQGWKYTTMKHTSSTNT